MTTILEESQAYKKLLAEVEQDECIFQGPGPDNNDYRSKLQWILDRASHYADVLDVSSEAILAKWEESRSYWYMNFYQDRNQPLLTGGKVFVFATRADLNESVGSKGFRCPNCNGVSTSAYACDSGVQLVLINSDGQEEACNWKVGGLFGDLGKGVFVFVKELMEGDRIFKPIAWEEKP